MNKFRYWLANAISGGELLRLSEGVLYRDDVINKRQEECDFYASLYRKHLRELIEIHNHTSNVKSGTGQKVNRMCKEALDND